MDKRVTDWDSRRNWVLSSAVTWLYGFLNLFGIHFLILEIKAWTESLPGSFLVLRFCRTLNGSEAVSAAGSNVAALFLCLFRWCHCGAYLSLQIIPVLFQESGTYSLRMPVLYGIFKNVVLSSLASSRFCLYHVVLIIL